MTTVAQCTPDLLVSRLNDLISDAPGYVRKHASRILDSLTAGIAEAEAADPQVDTPNDDEHREEEDEPL